MYALIPKVTILRDQLKTHLLDGRRGELVREGIRIALIGPPNAGTYAVYSVLFTQFYL